MEQDPEGFSLNVEVIIVPSAWLERRNFKNSQPLLLLIAH
jgi:hypothetical protein